MQKLLMTGAAGRVGTALRPYLRSRYRLRLFDRLACEAPAEGEEAVEGDLGNERDLEAALDGVSGVIHLACVHGHDLDFETSLDANYRALLALLEKSVKSGIRRFVYASSHHVFGLHRRDGFRAETAHLAPDAFYGLSKVFGEAACSMYSRRYGISTLVIRIGNADLRVHDDRTLRMWVSARDLAELISIGVEHHDIDHEIVYGTSICPRPLFENTRASELGYMPRDHAQDHLAPDFVEYESMERQSGRDWVGGAYAAAPLPFEAEGS